MSNIIITTLNENYNRPLYILAAGAELKRNNRRFKFYIKYQHLPKLFEWFYFIRMPTSWKVVVRIKATSIKKVTSFAKDKMNPWSGIHENKFMPEMLPNALICQPNASKFLMQSDIPWCQCSSSKKGTVISSTLSIPFALTYKLCATQ